MVPNGRASGEIAHAMSWPTQDHHNQRYLRSVSQGDNDDAKQ